MSGRYARQTVLPEVGPEGQARLGGASVLVVGAGGLGCALLPYLAAAGVGRLRIVDHDLVEESNLHRQPLYRMSDLGRPKASAAAEALAQLNPHTTLEALLERLDPDNAARLLTGIDVAVDAADSLAVSYILSDECQGRGLALVSASVLGLAGYVGAFCAGAPSYRAVFPEMPRQAGSCSGTGVLGTAVGVMGTLEAHLTLAVILRMTPSVLGRLLTVDFRTLRVGEFSFAGASEPTEPALRFIAPQTVRAEDLVIDLRSLEEAPRSPFRSALRLAVEQIERGAVRPEREERVVLCCRSGVRAWRAAAALRRQGHEHLALIALGD
jgi:molybdopterin/thiamine biosynthesis adenylyltransferase/rhodanese-related sulfurtransferase